MYKICTKCNSNKLFKEFNKDKKSKDGFGWICRCCSSEYNKQLYFKNKNKMIAYAKTYQKTEKSKLKRRTSLKLKEYNRRYTKTRIQKDIKFKLTVRLRVRLNQALKGNYKNGSSIKDLGCSVEYLKSYLELQFQPGMTWDNHGEWHIDHIIPLSSFDLTDRDQLLKVCHYTNLQPLWAEDNLKKSNKLLNKA